MSLGITAVEKNHHRSSGLKRQQGRRLFDTIRRTSDLGTGKTGEEWEDKGMLDVQLTSRRIILPLSYLPSLNSRGGGSREDAISGWTLILASTAGRASGKTASWMY